MLFRIKSSSSSTQMKDYCIKLNGAFESQKLEAFIYSKKNWAFGLIIASVLNTSIDTLAFFNITNKIICADSDQTSLLVSTELLNLCFMDR